MFSLSIYFCLDALTLTKSHNRKCRLCKLIIENVWGSASKYQKCRVPILQAPNELAVHYFNVYLQNISNTNIFSYDAKFPLAVSYVGLQILFYRMQIFRSTVPHCVAGSNSSNNTKIFFWPKENNYNLFSSTQVLEKLFPW